jgi:hypothetical protein
MFSNLRYSVNSISSALTKSFIFNDASTGRFGLRNIS